MRAAADSTLERADRVLRQHGRTFAWARRFLGQRHAERATLLYAFCRHIDDLVDEADGEDDARSGLHSLRSQLSGEAEPASIVHGALEVLGGTAEGIRAAFDLIDGVESDLEPVRCATEGELLDYCYRVAGTVGIMMCQALDRPVPAAYPHAADLGIGMQLTNIARDIHEDAGLGRRYLPASWVGELEPRSILEPSLEERALLIAARKRLLTLAERYYESGRRGLSHLPLRARYAILVAAQNYRAIGPRALRLGNQLDRRAHVSTAAKVGVTMRSLLTGSLTPSFWLRLGPHDDRLHHHLPALAWFGSGGVEHG